MNYITEIIRSEQSKLQQRGWILLYGRRKVGKTYLLRRIYDPDVYILIKRDRSLWSEDLSVDIPSLSLQVRQQLKEGNTVVIDEFQRLKQSMLEEITLSHPKGKLILSGSSLRVVNNVLAPNSPLLGFFTPIKLGLISPQDMITSLSSKFTPAKVIEASTFLRDPWLIPFYEGETMQKFLYRVVTQFPETITSLIGEIFKEEERKITGKYEAILSLVGAGTWKAKEIASILYNRNVITEPSSSHINQYLKNLRGMDVLDSYRIYHSKTKFNRLKSPVMNIFYYLDDRYNIAERQTSLQEIKPTLHKLLALEIQNFCADLFSSLYEGRKEYFIGPHKEIDFIITQRDSPVCIGEVKWGVLQANHLQRFKEVTNDFACEKTIIAKEIPNNLQTPHNIKTFTPKELIHLLN